jgi:hypothetical protein
MDCVVISISPINTSAVEAPSRPPVLIVATCDSNYFIVFGNSSLASPSNSSTPLLSSLIAPSVLLASTGTGQIATTAGAFLFVLGNSEEGGNELSSSLPEWHRSVLGFVGSDLDADEETVRLKVRFHSNWYSHHPVPSCVARAWYVVTDRDL